MIPRIFLLMTLTSLATFHSIHSQNFREFHWHGKTIRTHWINQTLYITCNVGPVLIDFTTFPAQRLGDKFGHIEFRGVKIENCIVPNGNSFDDLFKHFGIDKSLRILSFEGLNIGSSLDNRFSTGFNEVEKLVLPVNGIVDVSKPLFESMKSLSTLDLSFNQITKLPSNVFYDLVNLTVLNLAGNKLKYLPAGTFANQTKLKKLYLGENRLETLTNETFRGLDSLVILSFHGNILPDLADDVFHNIPKLRQILLGHGNMKIPSKIFASNKRLKYVELRKVNIGNGLLVSGLEELIITRSQLSIVTGLSNITNITIAECTLSNTALTSTTFKELSSTRNLNLASNGLEMLDDGLFDGLKNLQLLHLQNNRLAVISK